MFWKVIVVLSTFLYRHLRKSKYPKWKLHGLKQGTSKTLLITDLCGIRWSCAVVRSFVTWMHRQSLSVLVPEMILMPRVNSLMWKKGFSFILFYERTWRLRRCMAAGFPGCCWRRVWSLPTYAQQDPCQGQSPELLGAHSANSSCNSALTSKSKSMCN